MINKYGEESNVVRVRVHGLFPLAEDDVFIPINMLEDSISADLADLEESEIPYILDIGCDVARFGDDKTVIGYRADSIIKFYKKRQGQDTMATANDIVMLGNLLRVKYKKFKRQICIKIDDSGVGGGVTDRLKQLKSLNPDLYGWMRIIPVNFGMRIEKSKYYDDTTTYMMSVVKALISGKDEEGKPKKCEIQLPNDSDLVGQLSVRKYYFTDQGKIKVESKKEMKKRNLPSPDEADCVLLCCLPVNRREEYIK